jgi:hypothetical protein
LDAVEAMVHEESLTHTQCVLVTTDYSVKTYEFRSRKAITPERPEAYMRQVITGSVYRYLDKPVTVFLDDWEAGQTDDAE